MQFARFILPALLSLLASGPVAGQDASRHGVMIAEVFDTWIRPLHADLRAAAFAQVEAWAGFCSNPDAAGIAAVRGAYANTADAWSLVEFIRFGPAVENFRAERMSYWPDRKNSTARALAVLLDRTGTSDLAPDRVRQMSAAAQGLPAIERLLFDPEVSAASFLAGSPSTARRCALGRAVADNVAGLAKEIEDGWNGFDRTDGNNIVVRLATDLVALFQTLRDVKLAPVLGDRIETAKPRSAEGWRSRRMTRSIALNLKSGQQLLALLAEESSARALGSSMALETAIRIAEGLPHDAQLLAADPARRSELVLLYDAVTSARDSIAAELPAILGISLGFNSLDGD